MDDRKAAVACSLSRVCSGLIGFCSLDSGNYTDIYPSVVT